jgi:hypothetical protein
LVTAAILVLGTSSAMAQRRPAPRRPAPPPGVWAGRAVAAVNIGYQGNANDFTQTVTFEEFVEEGTIDTDYAVKAAPIFDASLAVRLWRNLGAGVAISSYTKDKVAELEADLPHPFFDNRFRTVTGESDPLERQETGVHLQAVYMLPLANRLHVLLSGGPSFFNISQNLVTRVEYTHAFPFDSATFRSATTHSDSGSAVGFNAGADVTWMLSRVVGVGGGFRFAKAEVDLTASEGNDVTVDGGGYQALGGLRIAF